METQMSIGTNKGAALRSKFSPPYYLDDFDRGDVERAFAFIASRGFTQRIGSVVERRGLYAISTREGYDVDLIDAVMRFLTRHGFYVRRAEGGWIIRKQFEPGDVAEAVALALSLNSQS